MTDLGVLSAVRPLLVEVGDAKRVRVASTPGSLAEQAFARTWARLLAGEDPAAVALTETAAAVCRARLSGIDGAVLHDAGMATSEATDVFLRAFDEVSGALPGAPSLREHVRLIEPAGPPPAFVDVLSRQPRAGATCPGKPRLVVEPPESHSDHCFTTAVYGALLAPVFGAEPVAPFLIGVAHHLHNVYLPDAGYAGEILLGEHLERVITTMEQRALAALPRSLQDRLREVLLLRADASVPEAQAFHAADVLDRVLQVHHHARAAAFTSSQALDELELVHAGPVQAFHVEVLAASGL